MTVAIFGSCVTRDLFEDPTLRAVLGVYAARSSVISVVAPPVAIAEERVQLPSAWQRRCVLADFHKTFFSSLAETRPEWLVVDLIDERFDLLQTADSYVTHSSALEAAGLREGSGIEFTAVRRMSPHGCLLFEAAAALFAARVADTVAPDRVILHRARWCTSYRLEGETVPFTGERLALCERQNTMLDAGYDALERAFAGRATVVDAHADDRLADGEHHWGLEPFHYQPSYNEYATAALRATLGLT